MQEEIRKWQISMTFSILVGVPARYLSLSWFSAVVEHPAVELVTLCPTTPPAAVLIQKSSPRGHLTVEMIAVNLEGDVDGSYRFYVLGCVLMCFN